jgi:hypothetical protein
LPFGFEIRNTKDTDPSFVTPSTQDGALEQVTSGAGFFGYSFDANMIPKDDVQLINRYRGLAQIPEVNNAIEEIVSDAIVTEDTDDCVKIDFVNADKTLPKNIQSVVIEEFKNILEIMQFNQHGYDIFRQWYIDGRDFRHIVVDENELSDGIKDIRYIDPRKIKKIREVTKEKNAGGVEIITGIEEYFIYNDSGVLSAQTGIKLSPDTIAYTPSGLVDDKGNVIGYLHSAIKPANMLRYLEDAAVIYNITRAPERRIFYIDVADLPRTKAEQYLKDTMNKYRNKITYSSETGDIKDDRQNFSMLEDYWLPRRSNGRSTEITTLPGAQPWGTEQQQYFLNKLMNSLRVPLSRLNSDNNFTLGRSEMITREEVKFSKFIDRVRRQFCNMFDQLLRVQLVLKGVIAPEDWPLIASKIRYVFARDNYFSELKDNEILQQRIQMLEMIQPFIGTFYSEEFVKEKILRLSTEDQMQTYDDLSAEVQPNRKAKKNG